MNLDIIILVWSIIWIDFPFDETEVLTRDILNMIAFAFATSDLKITGISTFIRIDGNSIDVCEADFTTNGVSTGISFGSSSRSKQTNAKGSGYKQYNIIANFLITYKNESNYSNANESNGASLYNSGCSGFWVFWFICIWFVWIWSWVWIRFRLNLRVVDSEVVVFGDSRSVV